MNSIKVRDDPKFYLQGNETIAALDSLNFLNSRRSIAASVGLFYLPHKTKVGVAEAADVRKDGW